MSALSKKDWSSFHFSITRIMIFEIFFEWQLHDNWQSTCKPANSSSWVKIGKKWHLLVSPRWHWMSSTLLHKTSKIGWADTSVLKLWRREASVIFLEPILRSYACFGIFSWITTYFRKVASQSIFFGCFTSLKCIQSKVRDALLLVVWVVPSTQWHYASGCGSSVMQLQTYTLMW